MAEPRKIFRIEETAAMPPAEHTEDAQAPRRHAEMMHEIGALREILAAIAPRQTDNAPTEIEAGRLTSELNLIYGALSFTTPESSSRSSSRNGSVKTTRIAHELDAVMGGTEDATQKILAAAEEIDQTANNLSAALKGKVEQGYAQDIQDLVIRIFEACNFQDLTSQRVTKVMAALQFIEGRIRHVLDELANAQRGDGGQLLNGPRLAIDSGHATQCDIDAIFGAQPGDPIATKQSGATTANTATGASPAAPDARSPT